MVLFAKETTVKKMKSEINRKEIPTFSIADIGYLQFSMKSHTLQGFVQK